MIKYAIYSIKDVVTGNFSDIQAFVNRDQAIRYFKGLCAESKIKTDLQLFELGEYDIQTKMAIFLKIFKIFSKNFFKLISTLLLV